MMEVWRLVDGQPPPLQGIMGHSVDQSFRPGPPWVFIPGSLEHALLHSLESKALGQAKHALVG